MRIFPKLERKAGGNLTRYLRNSRLRPALLLVLGSGLLCTFAAVPGTAAALQVSDHSLSSSFEGAGSAAGPLGTTLGKLP